MVKYFTHDLIIRKESSEFNPEVNVLTFNGRSPITGRIEVLLTIEGSDVELNTLLDRIKGAIER